MSDNTTHWKVYAVIKPCGCLRAATTLIPGDNERDVVQDVASLILGGHFPQLYDYSDLVGRKFSCNKCEKP